MNTENETVILRANEFKEQQAIGQWLTGTSAVVEKIIDAVSKKTGVPREMIFLKKRSENLAWARFRVIYLASKLTAMLPNDIAQVFQAHRSMVAHGITAVEERMSVDENFKQQMQDLLKQFTKNTEAKK